MSGLKNHIVEMWARSVGLGVKPHQLPGLVADHPLTPLQAADKILSSIVDRFSPHDNLFETFRTEFSDETALLVSDAANVADCKFTILGTDLDYSSGIRWHFDPVNGHEFSPGEFYKKIRHSHPDGGYDIKYPWELSRLQHLPRLAIAYRLTGDKKYTRALISQTSDWIKNNPVGFGPNWACTMDVAIRAANMSYAFALAGNYSYPDNFKITLACSLISHGRFIANNLEWSDKLTSNHYLADIAGLAVLSFLLVVTIPESSSWLFYTGKALDHEIRKQVYTDGWDFEASTAYHRLAMECFMYPLFFAAHDEFSLSKEYFEILEKMAQFASDISMPSGEFPLIGDNDSGLFMSLHPRDLSVISYLPILVKTLMGEPLEKIPEVFWLPRNSRLTKSDTSAPVENSAIRGIEYPDGGLFIIRSDSNHDMVTFRLGPVGQNGNGGHAHNDQLSLTIWFAGKPIVVDPGSAVYTSDPEKRNLYRSTKSHATIILDNREQNPFVSGDLFTLLQVVKPFFKGFVEEEDIIGMSGTLYGYGPWSEKEVAISRTVRYDSHRRQVEIKDRLELSSRAANVTVSWHFPLAPGLKAETRGQGYLKITSESGTPVAEILFLPGWSVELLETAFSPSYGTEHPNITLSFRPPPGTIESEFIIRCAPGLAPTRS